MVAQICERAHLIFSLTKKPIVCHTVQLFREHLDFLVLKQSTYESIKFTINIKRFWVSCSVHNYASHGNMRSVVRAVAWWRPLAEAPLKPGEDVKFNFDDPCNWGIMPSQDDEDLLEENTADQKAPDHPDAKIDFEMRVAYDECTRYYSGVFYQGFACNPIYELFQRGSLVKCLEFCNEWVDYEMKNPYTPSLQCIGRDTAFELLLSNYFVQGYMCMTADTIATKESYDCYLKVFRELKGPSQGKKHPLSGLVEVSVENENYKNRSDDVCGKINFEIDNGDQYRKDILAFTDDTMVLTPEVLVDILARVNKYIEGFRSGGVKLLLNCLRTYLDSYLDILLSSTGDESVAPTLCKIEPHLMQVTYGLFEKDEQTKWALKIASVTAIVTKAKGSIAVFELQKIMNGDVIQSPVINSEKLMELVLEVPDESFDAVGPSVLLISKELVKWMIFHFEKLTPDDTLYSEAANIIFSNFNGIADWWEGREPAFPFEAEKLGSMMEVCLDMHIAGNLYMKAPHRPQLFSNMVLAYNAMMQVELKCDAFIDDCVGRLMQHLSPVLRAYKAKRMERKANAGQTFSDVLDKMEKTCDGLTRGRNWKETITPSTNLDSILDLAHSPLNGLLCGPCAEVQSTKGVIAEAPVIMEPHLQKCFPN